MAREGGKWREEEEEDNWGKRKGGGEKDEAETREDESG